MRLLLLILPFLVVAQDAEGKGNEPNTLLGDKPCTKKGFIHCGGLDTVECCSTCCAPVLCYAVEDGTDRTYCEENGNTDAAGRMPHPSFKVVAAPVFTMEE
jgi:hypothetical protein